MACLLKALTHTHTQIYLSAPTTSSSLWTAWAHESHCKQIPVWHLQDGPTQNNTLLDQWTALIIIISLSYIYQWSRVHCRTDYVFNTVPAQPRSGRDLIRGKRSKRYKISACVKFDIDEMGERKKKGKVKTCAAICDRFTPESSCGRFLSEGWMLDGTRFKLQPENRVMQSVKKDQRLSWPAVKHPGLITQSAQSNSLVH